jgi:hypothetical protein
MIRFSKWSLSLRYNAFLYNVKSLLTFIIETLVLNRKMRVIVARDSCLSRTILE